MGERLCRFLWQEEDEDTMSWRSGDVFAGYPEGFGARDAASEGRAWMTCCGEWAEVRAASAL